MASFVYKARDVSGKPIGGSIEADNERQVAERLRESGYIVTSIKAKDLSRNISFSFGSKVALKDIAVFSRQFAIMIQSGIALLRSLDILAAQQENKTFKSVLLQVKKTVEEGSALSKALANHPKVFPEIFINMIRAGEVGGVMDEALERLAEHFDKEHELREKIKSATTYPLVICFFAIVVVNVLIIFVIPQFAEMFSGFGAELPGITKFVLNLSKFMRANFLYILGAVAVLAFLFNRYRKSDEGKRALDSLAIRVPVFGTMVLKISIARFSRTLGTLVKSGVPILLALEVTEKTAGNLIVAKGIADARESIREGESISGPLTASGVFPPMVTQMIAVGEESGSIEAMLNRIADFYEREVKVMVDGLTALIEPLMIIFLAVVVGGIVSSIMLPMFDVFSQIK